MAFAFLLFLLSIAKSSAQSLIGTNWIAHLEVAKQRLIASPSINVIIDFAIIIHRPLVRENTRARKWHRCGSSRSTQPISGRIREKSREHIGGWRKAALFFKMLSKRVDYRLTLLRVQRIDVIKKLYRTN